MSEKTLEIWECTIPGRVTMEITNERGRPKTLTVIGKGQRMRISATDREIAEEGVRKSEHNPFRNGMLVRVDKAGNHVPSPEELSDEELVAIFELNQDDFRATVTELGEVNVRRLKAMVAEVDASKSEIETLDEVIAARFPIGGTVPSYEEMQPTARR